MNVSVIITTYNSEIFISESIQSVLNQTYQNFEIIVVDDLSTDRTKSIVQKLIEKDSRIKWFQFENNFGGPARGRNYGIDNAKYDLIAFLDSDDIWLQNKLEKQIEVMNKHKIYFCSSAIKRFSGKTPKFKSNTDLNFTQINFKKLLIRCYIPLSSVIFSKSNFNFRFDESKNLIAFEDYDSWLKIHKKINYSIKLNSQLVFYRVNDFQISKDKTLRFYQHYKIRNKYINSRFSKIYSCFYIFLMLCHLAFNYLFKKL